MCKTRRIVLLFTQYTLSVKKLLLSLTIKALSLSNLHRVALHMISDHKNITLEKEE